MAWNPVKKISSSVKKLTTKPGEWGENFLMNSNPIGLSLGQFDKWTGGTGDFRSSMGNPYVQAGAGVAASFAGAPWYSGMALGSGMGAASGGNTGDVMSGMQYGGLGQAGGNIAQTGYGAGANYLQNRGANALGSAAAEEGFMPIAGESTSLLTPDITPELANQAQQGLYASGVSDAGFTPDTAQSTMPGVQDVTRGALPRMAGMATPTIGPGGYGGGGGGGRSLSGGQMLGYMGAKTGLGYLSNMQAQQALEPELEARRRAMERIRRLQENPALAYRNDPALSAMRSRALGATGARYRAKFGGGEGGALARDLYRTGAASDRAALNQSLAGEYQMLGATQPAVGQNLGAGGTPLGAFTGPATGAMNDYQLLQFMGAL